MRAYKEYKNTSEAVWYSQIPVSWESTKMRTLFSERNVKVSDKEYAALSVGKMGIVPQLDTAIKSDDSDNRKMICEGDFAINSRSDRKGAGGISNYTGSCSNIIIVLKPYDSINKRYYHYLLRSHGFVEEFYRNGKGLVSDLWTTKWQEMRNIYIPVPSNYEQDQIVRFLDWKTSEINMFISEKKKQINHLEELKKQIIDNAITNGIRTGRKTKISKAAWMGEVPVDWKEYRVKNVVREVNNRSEKGLEPHLSMSQKKGLVTDDEDIDRSLQSESYAGAKICDKDDLVLNRLKAHLGVFALAPFKGVVSPDYTVLKIDTRYVVPQFLEYYLKSNACRGELVVRVRGIVEGFWRLYTDDLGAIPICIPSVQEQKEILDYITEYDMKHNAWVEAIKNEIKCVEEYRTKLISDVVTGQIDVRDEVIPAYEPSGCIEETIGAEEE